MRIISAFVLLLLFGFISCSNKNSADLVLLNGKVWIGVNDTTFEEAIAIKGNQIIAVGKNKDIQALAGSKTQVIDLGGKLTTAGFNDAHIHFLSGSLGLNEVDLNDTHSPEEVVGKVNLFINDNPSKEWITGRGWQYTFFENGLPDHESLAGILNDKPVFIRAYDGHSAWANKKALAVAGIDRNTKFDGFGEIVKDKNGEPTGTLRESAMGLVSKHIPEPDRADKLNALRKGIKLAASLGITSLQASLPLLQKLGTTLREADWQVTERTRLSAGMRYMEENKSIDASSTMKIAGAPSLAMTTTVPTASGSLARSER